MANPSAPPTGWPDKRDAASLIRENDRERLIGLGLSRDAISALGEIVIQARDDNAAYRTPKEVREAIDRIRGAIGPLREALDECPGWAAGRIDASAFVSPPKGPG